jgi:dihydrofolate reductase
MFKNDLFIIGGEEIYRQTLPYADKIELTYIEKEFEGDAFFPEIPNDFKETARVDLECEEFKYSYITYKRNK